MIIFQNQYIYVVVYLILKLVIEYAFQNNSKERKDVKDWMSEKECRRVRGGRRKKDRRDCIKSMIKNILCYVTYRVFIDH